MKTKPKMPAGRLDDMTETFLRQRARLHAMREEAREVDADARATLVALADELIVLLGGDDCALLCGLLRDRVVGSQGA